MKVVCGLCKSKMNVKIIPCGKTAFLEADCPKCKSAVDLEVTAKTRRNLENGDKIVYL